MILPCKGKTLAGAYDGSRAASLRSASRASVQAYSDTSCSTTLRLFNSGGKHPAQVSILEMRAKLGIFREQIQHTEQMVVGVGKRGHRRCVKRDMKWMRHSAA